MELTLFLSQIVGIYLFVASLSMLLYPVRIKRAVAEMSKSYILPYFDGALALLVGLLIVLIHNDWSTLPAVIVTLVGWLAVLEGFAMMLLPQESIRGIVEWIASPSVAKTFSVVGVVAGAYLMYVSFLV